MNQQKIISLLPAATEIICALGLEGNLVGRSHECDFPESVKNLPVCSDAKFLSGASSEEINQQVMEILTNALSIYQIDQEMIEHLKPDVVITQAQCDVCAVSLKDVETALINLLANETQIISLQPNTLADIFGEISTVASILDAEEQGKQLIEDLEERVNIVRHKLKFFPDKPKVVMIEWLSPMMVAGNWIPELVEIAGGKSVLAENGKHSPFVTWEQIYDENPEIIVVAPCGFSISRTLQEIDLLLNLPGWIDLDAVKNNRVYIADGNAYFNRSGPRIVDSIEILAEIITPKYFSFGYEGAAWIKFEM
ncbi:MAG: cobalamin-binding protein [Sphingobacteriales bacterium]|nr:cobalamin-binding protein [Sphingobacteriales bacterium]